MRGESQVVNKLLEKKLHGYQFDAEYYGLIEGKRNFVDVIGLYDDDWFYVKISGKSYAFDTSKSSETSIKLVKHFKKIMKHNAGRAIKYLEKECGLGVKDREPVGRRIFK